MEAVSAERFVTPEELSEASGLGLGAIYQRIRRRQLPARRVGRLIRLPLNECLRRLVRDVPAIDGEGQGNG